METILYSFGGGSDANGPISGVTMDSSGNLYGTTELGGTKGFGTVFQVVPGMGGTWTEKILHNFSGGNDGSTPYSGVILDTVGNVYGMTSNGGPHDYGIVFQLTPEKDGVWIEHIVHAFTGGAGDSSSYGSLVFDHAGNLYAEAIYSVLEFSPSSNGWIAKNIHEFVGGSDGAYAECGLTIDAAGNLYGMTYTGGKHHGTVFQLSPGTNGTWTETILHSFIGGGDGEFPVFASPTVDSKGNVFGTTPSGGTSNVGVAFEVKP